MTNKFSKEGIDTILTDANALLASIKSDNIKRRKYLESVKLHIDNAEYTGAELQSLESQIKRTEVWMHRVESAIDTFNSMNSQVDADVTLLDAAITRVESCSSLLKSFHDMTISIFGDADKIIKDRELNDSLQHANTNQTINSAHSNIYKKNSAERKQNKNNDTILNLLLAYSNDYRDYIYQSASQRPTKRLNRKLQCVNVLFQIIDNDKSESTANRINHIIRHVDANRNIIKAGDDRVSQKFLKVIDYIACVILFPFYPAGRAAYSCQRRGTGRFWQTESDIYLNKIDK